MKGMALEIIFKMFLSIVVILVVIGLIISFRTEILKALKLCNYLPEGCPPKAECSTIRSTESTVTESVLSRYCELCWSKTGAMDYKSLCMCYIVNVTGTFSPIAYETTHCELSCSRQATSLFFTYNHLLNKVLIEC